MERGKREWEWKGDRARGNWKVNGTEQKKTGEESGKGERKGKRKKGGQ